MPARDSTRSSTSASGGASSSRRPRSTAASGPPTTTAPSASMLLRNVKDAWWRSMVQLRDDVVGLDAAILGRRRRSGRRRGHLANFTDPLVDCTNCKQRFREDKLDDPASARAAARTDSFTEARQFNLMFKTHAGPVEDDGRRRLPAPRDGPGHVRQLRQRAADAPARSRRSASPRWASASATRSPRRTSSSAPVSSSRWRWSTSCRRPTAAQWYEYWCDERFDWYLDLGIPEDHAAPAPHDADELSPLLGGHDRRRVPLPVGLGRARGHRQPHRLRPHASTPRTRARSSSTSTRPPTSATCPT